MAGYGRLVGIGGGGALFGHEQGMVGMVGGACLGAHPVDDGRRSWSCSAGVCGRV